MSTFTNRFDITAYADLVRIVFKDCIHGPDGDPVAHLIMRRTDAAELAEYLVKTLAKPLPPPVTQ